MAGTAVTASKISAGGVVVGVLGFLAANFSVSAKTAIGSALIALVSYIVGAIVHKAPAQP